MLFLIGGAARSGKTLIARRLLSKHRVPCFCVDYLVNALEEGAPELGISAEARPEERARAVWPRIEPMLRSIVEMEPAYVVEGNALWPRGVRTLVDAYGDAVRACFLGYAITTPEIKLRDIRQYGGGVHDWIHDHDDADILDLMAEMIAYSRYLRDACRALDLPYFDVSDDFTRTVNKAYRSIAPLW
ncbi:MAG TPA: hypothetical protein GX714_02885 [Chloroflexi bacterium]|jgi:hypothetical protein|nr:hypothetical protein [Chloroflexota bacterium]